VGFKLKLNTTGGNRVVITLVLDYGQLSKEEYRYKSVGCLCSKPEFFSTQCVASAKVSAGPRMKKAAMTIPIGLQRL